MADVDVNAISGSQTLPTLAPDLSAPSNWQGGGSSVLITGINPSAGLTDVLNITNQKGVISLARFTSMAPEDYTIELTIDDEIIFNDTWTVTSASPVLWGGDAAGNVWLEPVPFYRSFLLRIQSTTDTNIEFEYIHRKLL
jgi:hypothetical protein